MARNRHTGTMVLAGLVAAGAGLVVWSQRQVPDDVRAERHDKLLAGVRRDLIDRIEITAGAEHTTLVKADGHWQVVTGSVRHTGDDAAIEHLVTDAEYAEPARALGTLDGTLRDRSGLANPRARVVMHATHGPDVRFAIGGAVAGSTGSYVETDGRAYEVAGTFASTFTQRAIDLRDKTLSDLEPARTDRVEIARDAAPALVLAHRDGQWFLGDGGAPRAARTRVDAALDALRDLHATRFLADVNGVGDTARFGLEPSPVTVRATRAGHRTDVWRLGGACAGHDDEVSAWREGSAAVACVARAAFEAVTRPASEWVDTQLAWAHGDEVERVSFHGPDGDYAIVRDRDRWRLEGRAGEADPEAVEAWLNQFAATPIETHVGADTAARHALAPPARTITLTRTGTDGREVFEIGEPDSDRMYVRRAGENDILGLDPANADAVLVDAARFRARRLVRDVADQMVSLVTVAPSFSDACARNGGTWSLVRPITASGDPPSIRAVAERFATFDVDRWIASQPSPRHGFAHPSLVVTARFEGSGADPDPDAREAGVPNDASAPTVREYTLRVGAPASGGMYAMLDGQQGVFVLGRAAFDDLSQPHLDRVVMEVDRTHVAGFTIDRPRAAGGGTEHLVVRRDGDVWRTAAGGAVDRTRVSAFFEQIASIRAPRVFGYGPAPVDAHLDGIALTLDGAGAGAGADGGGVVAPPRRLVLGAPFAIGSESGRYARVDGLDATLSVSSDVATAITSFAP